MYSSLKIQHFRPREKRDAVYVTLYRKECGYPCTLPNVTMIIYQYDEDLHDGQLYQNNITWPADITRISI